MKNKKASVIHDNLLEVILAALGILLVVGGGLWLAYKVWTINQDQSAENAQQLLNDIVAKIEAIEDGDNATMLARRIKGDWGIIAYKKTDPIRPEKCFLQNCICIFPFDYSWWKGRGNEFIFSPDYQKMAESCQKEGYVRLFQDKTIEVITVDAISGVPDGIALSLRGEIKTRTYPRIYIGDKMGEGGVLQLNIDRRENLIQVWYDKATYDPTN